MTTVADMLSRAAALGDQLRAIHDDPGLHRLSADAWRRLSIELGGFADEAALDDARALLDSTPYLKGEVMTRGEIWWRSGQDRPAPWPGFSDGRGDMAAAYAERLAIGLSPAQCSAIAAWHVAELAPPEHWGKLDSFEQLAGMIGPLHRELAELDRQLAAELRVADLAWPHAGKPPCVTAGRGFTQVDEISSARLASAVAEQAADLAIAA